MTDIRSDPDTLLRELSYREAKKNRGRLKIFFGYAAGVGKTCAMLQAAHTAQHSGVDIVAGYIEPHERPETTRLIDGLEVIAPRAVEWKGVTVYEPDIDAILTRHPAIALIDELAHTNIHGSRNQKRYQDIEELLKAGIDVYTTVNVQHIESLNDRVFQITKIGVKERIPDKVIDEADQIELVDIEPEELITRLNEGKIYRDNQIERALKNFFTRENLVALREIAMRRIADQINLRAESQKTINNREYYTNEHILICLSSAPSNARVIRTAARMATAFHATFTALFVETPDSRELMGENLARLRSNLKLAEQLGAKIASVYGENVSEQIAEYAKAFEVSKIIIGRSNNKKKLIPKPTFVEALTALAPDLDIYIIPDNSVPYNPPRKRRHLETRGSAATDILKSVGILAAVTLLAFCFYALGIEESNIIMVYILGVLFTAACTNARRYSLVSSILSVLVFNFFFTVPRFSLTAYDSGYPVTFAVMFIAALLTSTLTLRVKEQARQNALKARRTEVLLETSQKLQQAESVAALYHVMGEQMKKLLSRTVLIYPVSNGVTLGLSPHIFSDESGMEPARYLVAEERAVAEWALKNNKNAGATTKTLSGAKCLCLSVRGPSAVYAIVSIVMEKGELDTFEKNVLISMLGEFGLSLEKEAINEAKKETDTMARQEQLRANLLRAISHDLRTPLTSISGNADILLRNASVLDEEKTRRLYADIYDDAMWLINLVENLLSLTRIDNAQMSISMQPELLDEVIHEALKHLNRRSIEYKINVALPNDMLMASMDAKLIMQVIINIVDNAIKYTKQGSEITIKAYENEREQAQVDICDNGNGISDADKRKIFDMFYTADKTDEDSRRGLGLGLSLCKSVISAHGGSISVRDNIPSGTIFSFTLSLPDKESGLV